MYTHYSTERQQNCVMQGFSVWDESDSPPEGANEDKIFWSTIYSVLL